MFIFESKPLQDIDHKNMSCADFATYMPGNEVEVMPGGQHVLQCSGGAGSGGGAQAPALSPAATAGLNLLNMDSIAGQQAALRMSSAGSSGAKSGAQGGPITLYPGQSRNGLILASQKPGDANGPANASTTVHGDFTVFNQGGWNQPNSVVKIPYAFTRKDSEKEVPYDLIQTRKYTVEKIQKWFNFLAVLPVAVVKEYEERIEGSEVPGTTEERPVETP